MVAVNYGNNLGRDLCRRDESLHHGLKKTSIDGTEAMMGVTLLLHGGGKNSGIERTGWKA